MYYILCFMCIVNYKNKIFKIKILLELKKLILLLIKIMLLNNNKYYYEI